MRPGVDAKYRYIQSAGALNEAAPELVARKRGGPPPPASRSSAAQSNVAPADLQASMTLAGGGAPEVQSLSTMPRHERNLAFAAMRAEQAGLDPNTHGWRWGVDRRRLLSQRQTTEHVRHETQLLVRVVLLVQEVLILRIQHVLDSALLLTAKLSLLLPDRKLLGNTRAELIRGAVERGLGATGLDVLHLRTQTMMFFHQMMAQPSESIEAP